MRVSFTVQGSMVITGKGDSIAIFSTILQAIRDVLQQKFRKLTGFDANHLTHISFVASKNPIAGSSSIVEWLKDLSLIMDLYWC